MDIPRKLLGLRSTWLSMHQSVHSIIAKPCVPGSGFGLREILDTRMVVARATHYGEDEHAMQLEDRIAREGRLL